MQSGERGGAEALYAGLERGLRAAGHHVDRIEMVLDESTFDRILESYVLCNDLDLRRYDAVISTKAPTYMVRHPRHISYLVHTVRVFYDMFAAEYGEGTPEQQHQRRVIHAFDRHGLQPGRVLRHFAIGHTPYRRLRRADPFWEGVPFEAVHLPPALEGFREPRRGRHLLLPGRLHRWKRIDLVIEAFKQVRTDVSLKIAGTGEDEDRLRRAAASDPRIHFLGYVDDARLLDLYADAIAVPFVPIGEDYGLVTVEAFRSKKPVITCVDSGEPAEIVRDSVSGFVVPPTANAIAAKLDLLIGQPELAAAMGERGHRAISHITWGGVVTRLLEPLEAGRTAGSVHRSGAMPSPRSQKFLVTDNQVLDPPVGGGRLRIYHLCRNLAEYASMTYVGAYDWPGPVYRDQMLGPKFREIVVPLTQVHFRLNSMLQRLAKGEVVLDVAIPLLLRYTPRFSEIANQQIVDADLIIVSHPWVYPYLKRRSGQPLVYDAQNCEYAVKRQILGGSMVGRLLARKTKQVEGQLCRASDLIFACSEEDKRRLVQVYGVDEAKILVVPNGVDTREITPADDWARTDAKRLLGLEHDASTVLFVGSGYMPNREALNFIVRVLAQECRRYQFLIMGGVGDLYLQSLNHCAETRPQNVRLFGVVDRHLRDTIYKASDVAVNPMFTGSGTNIKMFDFMAAGIPVIATEVGARGIEGSDDAFITCPASDFPRRLVALMEDTARREILRRNGRQLVEATYDWRVIAANAHGAIERVFGKPWPVDEWKAPAGNK
jgi:glycosyltransferase involved in cell wall biosynthesis